MPNAPDDAGPWAEAAAVLPDDAAARPGRAEVPAHVRGHPTRPAEPGRDHLRVVRGRPAQARGPGAAGPVGGRRPGPGPSTDDQRHRCTWPAGCAGRRRQVHGPVRQPALAAVRQRHVVRRAGVREEQPAERVPTAATVLLSYGDGSNAVLASSLQQGIKDLVAKGDAQSSWPGSHRPRRPTSRHRPPTSHRQRCHRNWPRPPNASRTRSTRSRPPRRPAISPRYGKALSDLDTANDAFLTAQRNAANRPAGSGTAPTPTATPRRADDASHHRGGLIRPAQTRVGGHAGTPFWHPVTGCASV